MFTAQGLLTLFVALTVRIPYHAIHYVLFKGIYRKYRNNYKYDAIVHVFRGFGPLTLKDIQMRFIENTVVLQNVAKAHPKLTSELNNYGESFDKHSLWIVEKPDRAKSDPVLIFLHGGAYYSQTYPTQIESIISIYKLLDPSKREHLSILLLDYSLVSNGFSMPTQMEELDFTFNNLAKTSDNILFLGDSAGGNLAIIYLQKLKLEKNPSKPYPKKLILVSPWVKLDPEPYQLKPGKSYYDNRNRDIITYDTFKWHDKFKAVLGDEPLESLLTSPCNVKPLKASDWDIPTLRNEEYDVLLIAGEDEAFRDDILEWAEVALNVDLASKHKYGDSNNVFDANKHQFIRERESNSPYVKVYVQPWGLHDPFALFESVLIKQVEKNRSLTLGDVDSEEFFYLTRITQFLNETL